MSMDPNAPLIPTDDVIEQAAARRQEAIAADQEHAITAGRTELALAVRAMTEGHNAARRAFDNLIAAYDTDVVETRAQPLIENALDAMEAALVVIDAQRPRAR